MNELPEPMSAHQVDSRFHLRKGTTRRAYEAGVLRGCLRKGRGGTQLWLLPSDAQDWFLRNLPTESEVKP